ncbi:acetyl-CoA carboxylase carboxyltransferase subunit alpha/beta [Fodinicola feengrottensis]|uniref:acetyl-CoA carboxylase carboxyltransferase subunit alpha/beta n=1 Tax=Fodinicola feengrottensis TaxID=435914 RepID=UPI0024429B85|nr:acetyl-CoA carboxylase carboxyltransferase subunit alpha/beta [Fodinicola feengrottensis]
MPSCNELIYAKKLERNLHVCPDCGSHHRLTAPQWLDLLVDPGAQPVLAGPIGAADPLGFVDSMPYPQRLEAARRKTGLAEAVVCVRGRIQGWPVVVAAMDFRFLGGSLGAGAGELIVAAAARALADGVPFVIVTAGGGGARMQEGVISLLQMARTSQALAELDEAGLLTVSVITDPTYGGVAASFATLTDVILAEPGARLGFAGPRVIAETVGETLPEGFQTAEFLLANGLIDDVRPRALMRATLGKLLAVADSGKAGRPGRAVPRRTGEPVVTQADQLPARLAWDVVQLARHLDRPSTVDHIGQLIDGFVELHGDRASGDCPAIVGGLGLLRGRPVVVMGHQKGHSTRELVDRNFGMASPQGYRKSARLMRLAAKLGRPVVTLVDTPGAHPGVAAEQHGQAVAIAQNLRLMSGLPVPIVAAVTGEGGSGGALALAVSDRLLVAENAVYSVISPEGCAAILWKSRAHAPRAAQALRVDARALLEFGVADGVVREPAGGCTRGSGAGQRLARRRSVRSTG